MTRQERLCTPAVRCVGTCVPGPKRANVCVNRRQLHAKGHVTWREKRDPQRLFRTHPGQTGTFPHSKAFRLPRSVKVSLGQEQCLCSHAGQLLLLFLLSPPTPHTFELLSEPTCSAQTFLFYYPWDRFEAQTKNRLSCL